MQFPINSTYPAAFQVATTCGAFQLTDPTVYNSVSASDISLVGRTFLPPTTIRNVTLNLQTATVSVLADVIPSRAPYYTVTAYDAHVEQRNSDGIWNALAGVTVQSAPVTGDPLRRALTVDMSRVLSRTAFVLYRVTVWAATADGGRSADAVSTPFVFNACNSIGTYDANTDTCTCPQPFSGLHCT